MWVYKHLFILVMLLVVTPVLVYVSLQTWSDIQSRNYNGRAWERKTQAFGSFLIDFPIWLLLFLIWVLLVSCLF